MVKKENSFYKFELARLVAEDTGIRIVDCEMMVESTFRVIREQLLEKGRTIVLTNIGTLTPYIRQPSAIGNPQTHESYLPKPRWAIRFDVSRGLWNDLKRKEIIDDAPTMLKHRGF